MTLRHYYSSWPDLFRPSTSLVMALKQDVDARDERGHDGPSGLIDDIKYLKIIGNSIWNVFLVVNANSIARAVRGDDQE